MIVIDGHEWAKALFNNGRTKFGSPLISEYSLRYMIKGGQECLDLTDYNIHGPLKLKNFNNLRVFDCSSERKLNPLTNYFNDDSRNNITSLDLSECPKLTKLNCSSNSRLTELNISNCSNLTNINVVGCKLRKVICNNSPYSPKEMIEKSEMNFCSYAGCREVAGNCDAHRMHYCKEEGCDIQIIISREYCSSHRSNCVIYGCSFRTSSPRNYCAYHKKEKELEQERERKRAQEQERERKRAQEREKKRVREELERKKDQLLHEKNQLQEQIAVKENTLTQLIDSTKSELVSKSIFPVKRREKEAAYQNYLDNLLTIQKQFAQKTPRQIQLEQQAKKYLSKKLSEKKIQSLCQTQMELTKLEVNLAELEKKLLQIQNQIV
jgi:hypothetical protein